MPNLNDLNALHLPTGSCPQQMIMSAGKRHPLRPVKPDGEVYRRFDARLGMWVSLRTLDIEQDLVRFNCWQNNPRVASFWQEAVSYTHLTLPTNREV